MASSVELQNFSSEAAATGTTGAGGEPAVQVAANEKGRSLVAATFIPAGSPVLVEEPYAYCVNDTSEFKNCNYCLQAIQDQYNTHKKCRLCNLAAYCCADCHRDSHHDILECRVFQVRQSYVT